MLAGRCCSLWAVMPEEPGDLCLRWCMIVLSSQVVVGGKEGSRILMLEWEIGRRESMLTKVLFVTSSMFSWIKSSSF